MECGRAYAVRGLAQPRAAAAAIRDETVLDAALVPAKSKLLDGSPFGRSALTGSMVGQQPTPLCLVHRGSSDSDDTSQIVLGPIRCRLLNLTGAGPRGLLGSTEVQADKLHCTEPKHQLIRERHLFLDYT